MSDLYIEVNGTGPDLVLLHGWGLNVRVWDGVVQDLSNRFRMITVDLPGHGRSPWIPGRGTPAEQAWLVHAALASVSTRYSLLGWSLGGQIALDLAAAMPAQVERLVLVATTPRFVSTTDWPHGMPPDAIARMAGQLRDNYQQTVSDFLELQVRGSADAPQVVAQLRKALFVHGEARLRALAAGLNTLATNDLRATVAHVQAPTLVIAGQNDRITPPSASRALAAALPDARYVEIRRAAHAPFLSHRRELVTLIGEFLRGEDTEAAAANAPVAASAISTASATHAVSAANAINAVSDAGAATETPTPAATAVGAQPRSTAARSDKRYRAVGKAIRAASPGVTPRARQKTRTSAR